MTLNTGSTEPSAAASPQTKQEQLLFGALALLRAGTRPTADMLVGQFGGSKATAVKAMELFWASWLPERLAAGALVPPPDAVDQAVRAVWELAQQAATKGLAGERAQLENERTAFAREREVFEAHRKTVQDEATTAIATGDQARQAAQELREALAAAQASLASALAEVERLGADVDRQHDELVLLRAEAERLADLQPMLDAATKARDAAQVRLEERERAIATEREQFRADLASQGAELSIARTQLSEQKALADERRSQLTARDQQLAQLQSENSRLLAETAAAHATVVETRQAVTDLTQRNEVLRRELENARARPSDDVQPTTPSKTSSRRVATKARRTKRGS